MKLKIGTTESGKAFGLPLEFVTKTTAILAQRRKGKTYTASVIAEELVASQQPFVALDPTGAWWGLLASGNGRDPGLPVVVLGGQHGHVPLERTGGHLVADLVVDHPGYYVIDFSLFESANAERQFATDFAERLYRLKGHAGKDFPLHLFVDEADRFVPQRSPSGDQRMLGAFEAIVRRGGLRGLGTTLISQRSAVVNKNVLEQIDCLITLRTVGPNDQAAIEGYIKAHGSEHERQAMMRSLASLDLGEAWVWEPGAEPALFERIRVRARHTFNSSATPKPGEKRVEPRKLAEVDIAAVRQRMADTIERAKSDDPKELRRQIADLQRQLAASKPAAKQEVKIERVEVPVLPEPMFKALTEGNKQLLSAIADHATLYRQVIEACNAAIVHRPKPAQVNRPPVPGLSSKREAFAVGRRSLMNHEKTSLKMRSADGGDGSLIQRSAERKVLIVLAQYPDGRSTRQVAILAGYAMGGGGFRNAVGRMRSLGLVDGRGDSLRITEAGLQALGPYEPLPTGSALAQHWLSQLDRRAEREALQALLDAYPSSLSVDEVASRTGYEAGGGGFRNALGKLRTLELVTGRGDLRASEELFG